MKHFGLLLWGAIAGAGCTKKADQCNGNADCTDPAFPFCDVNGAFAPSGGVKNICTIIPPDCPVDVCGCSPGAATCGSGQLATCNSDGMSTTATACALGCSSAGNACATFTPSNNLAASLIAASTAPTVQIPPGAMIDTDTGDVQGASISSTVVTDGAVSIRVFMAPSFTLKGATFEGTAPVAFVASGPIEIDDTLFLSGDTIIVQGPGAAPAGSPCDGAAPQASCGSGCQPGYGGGGNGAVGGAGGDLGTADGGAGGSAVVSFEPLVGGCDGGGDIPGGGGGAIQLVSGVSVVLNAIIDVSGGGGFESAGGGAGGTAIVEAPSVTVTATGGIAANGGGGGGGCTASGANGPTGSSPAAGGTCSDATLDGGDGGAGSAAAMKGGNGASGDSSTSTYGGGGGAVGRARIATADGTIQQDPEATLSVAVTRATLVAQ
jgi:hypothetical protein